MYETPKDLVDDYEKRRAKVPSLGVGFSKSKLDSTLLERLQQQLEVNVQKFRSEKESNFIKTENSRAYPSLLHYDDEFNQQLMRDLLPAHEEWSGVRLNPAICYGIRVYQNGSYLLSHSDRSETHIVSSTICVDSDLNKPWPLYVEDDEGKAHEVDMQPGDMVFFEGARLVHGRPYPMDGSFFASMFVHYTPIDWNHENE